MSKPSKKDLFKKPALFLGLSFIALGCTLGIACFSWFATPDIKTTKVGGLTGEATGSYFEGGTGTASDPYIIAKPKQLYYFAWLQDMGYFNKTDSTSTSDKIPTTYFKLKNDIDASGFVLPPCGIEKYPFVGNFDANNCTITNLTISNTIGEGYITDYPAILKSQNDELTKEEFEKQAEIVGFFGIIGEYQTDISYQGEDDNTNEVKNLYLDEITIKTKKDNLLVGIFAGYANGLIDNCGVHYAKMNINGATSKISTFNNVSEYTLIGSYNKSKFSWEQTSGGGSGGDAGYGTSTNIRTLHTFLTKFSLTTDGSDGIIKKGVAIPFKPDTSASLTEKSGTITVGGRTVTNASTIAVSSTAKNIGYYVGGDGESGVDSAASMRVFKDHYTSSTVDFDNIEVSSSADKDIYQDGEGTVPDRVKTYLKATTSDGTLQGYSVLRVGTKNNLQLNMMQDSGYCGIESGKVGTYSGNILVPNNCIWVAPQKSGTFEFVCTREKASWIYIWKLKRSDPGNYSSSLTAPDVNNQNTSFTNGSNVEVCGMQVSSGSSPYEALYYGTKITDDDITNGVEFAITSSGWGTSVLYIVYLDIGSDAEGPSGTTQDKTLNTTFDFVTKENGALTKIKNLDGTANDAYTKSNAFFKVNNTTDTRTFSWRRTTITVDEKETILVLYHDSLTPTVLSPEGTGGKEEAADDACTAKKSTS